MYFGQPDAKKAALRGGFPYGAVFLAIDEIDQVFQLQLQFGADPALKLHCARVVHVHNKAVVYRIYEKISDARLHFTWCNAVFFGDFCF